MPNRRQFIITALPLTCAGLALARSAVAEPEHLEESDKDALALSYIEDATQGGDKKLPGWQPKRTCANCQLFQGETTDAWGGCPAMGSKWVSAKGWCSAWEQG